jgi:ComF family protein
VVLAPPASTLVHALKYGGWPELADEMALPMARRGVLPRGLSPDAPLVPVPTTPKRERERGYNQARALARALAKRTGRPLVEALARKEGGDSQVSLHPAERRRNVLRAFSLREEWVPRLQGMEVVLVDDVLTTGATACAAAEVLGHAGCRSVGVLTFGRALPDHEAGRDPTGASGVPPIPPPGRPGAGS